MKGIEKIISDTLKSPNGKWSRKSLTMFVSFIMGILVGITIVVSHFITDTEISRDAVWVFYGFLTMAGYNGKLTLDDKKNYRENYKNNETIG